MKKIAAVAVLLLVMLSNKTFSQSNLTWIINDKIEKGDLKTRVEFNSSYAGIKNEAEIQSLVQKISSNKEVASAENKGKDANGNYQVTFIMKEPHNGKYYTSWAKNLGVTYIEMGGKKKSCDDLLAGKKQAPKK